MDPKLIIIVERYKFHKTKQQSVTQYLAKLQKSAETCEFVFYCEEAIRDRFVCGLRAQSIQCKLLAEASLTLQTAVEKVCAAELMEKEASGFHGDPHNVKKVEATSLNVSDAVKQIICQEIVFIRKHNVMDARSLVTS